MRRPLLLLFGLYVCFLFTVPAAAHRDAGLPPAKFASPAAFEPSLEQAIAPTRWAPAPQWRPAFETVDDDAGYDIRITCPDRADAQAVCPFPIPDIDDIRTQPRMVVDPGHPEWMAFNVLHGGIGVHPNPSDVPPTNRSRDETQHMTHSTFHTGNFFAQFFDNFYWSPWHPNDQGETPVVVPQAPGGVQVYGEDNAIALDGFGRVYIASLYAVRETSNDPFEYHMILNKGRTANVPIDYGSSRVRISAQNPGNVIDSMELVFEKQTNRMVLVWRESGRTTSGLSSWIGAAVTTPGQSGIWKQLPGTQFVGPCSSITNPIAEAGLVWVGCAPTEGYAYGLPENRGLVQVHSINPVNLTTSWISSTALPGVRAQHPILVNRGVEGEMALVSGGLSAEGAPYVLTSYGINGREWGDNYDFGFDFSRAHVGTDRALVDARIQDAEFVKRSNTLHMIYMERYPIQQSADPGGPNDPAAAGASEYYKALGTTLWNSETVLGFEDLDVGNATVRETNFINPAWQGVGTDIFDGLNDDLVIWHDPSGRWERDREFIIYSDAGNPRLGEVNEREYGPGYPGAPQAASPVPVANPVANPNLAGAAAGVLAGSMVLRMLFAKRKRTAEAPSL